MPRLHEIEEAPERHEIEDVVHDEVRSGDEQDLAIGENSAQGAGSREHGAGVCGQLGELGRGNGSVLARAIARVHVPEHYQHEGRNARDDERPTPAVRLHEPGDQRRRRRRARPQAGDDERLPRRPAIHREPGANHPGAHGEEAALRHAEQRAGGEEGHEDARACHCPEGRDYGGETDGGEHAPPAEPLSGKGARDLEYGVGEQERREQPTHLNLAEAELRHHPFRGDADARALDVAREREGKD